HGCNSVIATRMAMQLADWTITEAGFGFDLGAEKFFDIKCKSAGLDTAAVVLVATCRALKMHGGVAKSKLGAPDPEAVKRGLPNLDKHIESIRIFGESPVVALNRFGCDTEAEIAVVRQRCEELNVTFAESDHHERGGEGAEALALALMGHSEYTSRPFKPLYEWEEPIEDKIASVAGKMYGAGEIAYTKKAKRDIAEIEKLGYADLPVCIAKIPGSLSDDPKLRGRPEDFELTVRRVQVNAGAGFLVVLTGDIMRMPGLPRKPLAEQIDVRDGAIVGLE
ncbi:MAG: formate--tetrahydrofolate ligase, partial [bacterium]|nr:formate--tetrahydrofolate ligase [bacterium]